MTIAVNERRFLTVPLEVASVAETVRVVSTPAVIQTEDGSIGQVIQGAVAVELPLAGRRYTELALLVPGTAPTSPSWRSSACSSADSRQACSQLFQYCTAA